MNFFQGVFALIFSFVSRILSFETELFMEYIKSRFIYEKIILGVNMTHFIITIPKL